MNPQVAHPRWSQATEELIGLNERRPTLLFNGYGEHVADLYKGLGEGAALGMTGGALIRCGARRESAD